MKIPKPDLSRVKVLFSRPKLKIPKKRISIITFTIFALIAIVIFINKVDLTALSIHEKAIPCTDDCNLEGKLCEDAKIYECAIAEDGCKDKVLLEECVKDAVCSTVNKDKCYTPSYCDGDFHMCISDVYYKMCKNGKTVEDKSETKRCPDGMMCNRNPTEFAICVEKDY